MSESMTPIQLSIKNLCDLIAQQNLKSYGGATKEESKREKITPNPPSASQPQYREHKYCEFCKATTHTTNSCIRGNTPPGACYR